MRPGQSRALRRLGAVAGAAVAVVLAATPAFATSGRIDGFSTLPDGHLGVAFSAVGLAPGQTIDPTSVKVTLAGQPVPAVAQLVTQAQTQQQRATMLTIDLSASMRTPIGTTTTTRIDAAKQAADAYLAGVPQDVYVGVVTFSDTAKVALAPTQDHATVKRVVDSLTAPPNGSTALYDAVVLANGALASRAQGSLNNQLLLTDGYNQPGPNAVGNTQATAIASLKTTKVTLDAVSIGSDATGLAELTALTRAGGGATVSADNADSLTTIFATAANDQANAILVDVTVPPTVAGTSQSVDVTATAGGQTIGDSAVAPMPTSVTSVPSDIAAQYGPVPVAVAPVSITSQSWFLPVAVAAVGIGLFVLLAVAFLASDRENQTTGRVRRRLSRYSLTSRQPTQSTVATSGALGDSAVARSALELAGRVVQGRDLDTGLALKLDAAGIPLKPAEWMLIHVGITLLAALVFTLLSGFNLVATLLGLVLGLAVPYLYMARKESRRLASFSAQLPETLQLLAGSMAAGYSLPQALDAVVREASPPMSAELNRALVETRLGVPVEDALETVARRMNSMDFAWVVMAIRIQREVGGNLSEILTTVAATMRERERLRRQVQVLSAEGRLSAIILGALPLVLLVYFVLIRPEYIGLLITSPIGILMIVVGLMLMVAGAFWLRRVVKVEV